LTRRLCIITPETIPEISSADSITPRTQNSRLFCRFTAARPTSSVRPTYRKPGT
jgi:hypothetical protein